MAEVVSAVGHGPADVDLRVEEFVYDDRTVRMFLTAMLTWGIVAFLVGLIVALQLPFPFFNLGNEFTSFGRLRPLHTNAAIFAFAGNAIFAAIYYSTQRLCKARMFSDTLSKLHFWGWQLIILCAALTLPAGFTQGKEYAELEWPIDLLIAVVWVGFFGVNFFGTLARRRERHLYVALWFYIATIVTVAVLHVFNNLVVPVGLFKSYSIYAGAQDAFMQWWYGHNAVAFFLTTPFLGLMYYFLPKAAERPVFSYRLSIVHFWSLVFLYIWAGPHHLHYTAIPDWSSTLGMLFSLMLWMPSWGGMINGLLTLRGAWHKVTTDPVLKFFVVAITFYGMATFEGPLLSIKSVNALSHYTDWNIAHVHAGALGWVGFMSFGMMYWLLPRLFQTKHWSQKAASLHFWLATVGILLYIVPIYIAGITQGLMWRAMDENGDLVYKQFIETVQRLMPFYHMRILGGLCYMSGALVGVVNYYMTWKSRPVVYEEPVQRAAALRPDYNQDPSRPVATGLGVTTDLAQNMAVWSTFWWHRKWERLPLKFTVLVVLAVAAASLFEVIPTFVIRSNVPTIASVKPYTPLELAGRDIYISEGCYNCHSQMIRAIHPETKRYGEYSKPGEFVYDHPFQWGSRRIGPDLQREGGRQSEIWLYRHFKNPRMIEGSIMPPYPWLLKKELNFTDIPTRLRAMKALGVPYTDEQIRDGVQSARTQALALAGRLAAQNNNQSIPGVENKQVMALIAYLQRLGTDLKAQPETPTQPAAPAHTGGKPEPGRTVSLAPTGTEGGPRP